MKFTIKLLISTYQDRLPEKQRHCYVYACIMNNQKAEYFPFDRNVLRIIWALQISGDIISLSGKLVADCQHSVCGNERITCNNKLVKVDFIYINIILQTRMVTRYNGRSRLPSGSSLLSTSPSRSLSSCRWGWPLAP